jgi:hypothetical protein
MRVCVIDKTAVFSTDRYEWCRALANLAPNFIDLRTLLQLVSNGEWESDNGTEANLSHYVRSKLRDRGEVSLYRVIDGEVKQCLGIFIDSSIDRPVADN